MIARYYAERYEPRSWAIRDRETGRIVGYPGPTLENVAASLLKWETGRDGEPAVDLASFSQKVGEAERRIAELLGSQNEPEKHTNT